MKGRNRRKVIYWSGDRQIEGGSTVGDRQQEVEHGGREEDRRWGCKRGSEED